MMAYWIHPETRRYYRALLQQDLFGDWTVITSWGSLDSRQGRYRIHKVVDQAEGLMEIEAIDVRRRKRGYVRIQGEGRSARSDRG